MTTTEPGLPADQRTMTTENTIEAIPGLGVCDFCTSTPVVFAYPCGLVMLDTGAGAHASNDAWGACAHCHALLEADDRSGLLERAISGYIVQEGEQPAGALTLLRPIFAGLQDAFFNARLGDPEPVL